MCSLIGVSVGTIVLPFVLPPLFLRGGAVGNGLTSSGVMIHSVVFVEVETTASDDLECVAVASGARWGGSWTGWGAFGAG